MSLIDISNMFEVARNRSDSLTRLTDKLKNCARKMVTKKLQVTQFYNFFLYFCDIIPTMKRLASFNNDSGIGKKIENLTQKDLAEALEKQSDLDIQQSLKLEKRASVEDESICPICLTNRV